MTDPTTTPIPTKWVGPIRVSGNAVEGEHEVPLATYESPLWPSVGRGARISRWSRAASSRPSSTSA